MSSISELFGSTTGTNTQTTTKEKGDIGQGDFLKLMMTQLRNQDPFKPLDSGEFLSQIAQFSTVSGIQNLESLFSGLATNLVSNQALQASSLVGRDVLVPSDKGVLPTGEPMKGSIEVDAGVSNLVVGIYSGTGELVRRINLGTQTQGLVSYQWDGKSESGTQMAPGVYTVKAEGQQGKDVISLQALAQAKVESVTLNNERGGIILNLAGLGSTEFSSVKQIM